jgi:hypothetical protein
MLIVKGWLKVKLVGVLVTPPKVKLEALLMAKAPEVRGPEIVRAPDACRLIAPLPLTSRVAGIVNPAGIERVPVSNTILFAVLPRAESLEMLTVPPDKPTNPVNVLLPESVTVPLPALRNGLVPTIAAEMVALTSVKTFSNPLIEISDPEGPESKYPSVANRTPAVTTLPLKTTFAELPSNTAREDEVKALPPKSVGVKVVLPPRDTSGAGGAIPAMITLSIRLVPVVATVPALTLTVEVT